MEKTKAAWSCEASVDINYSSRTPVIIKCGKPAKLYGVAALCDDCAPKVLAKYAVKRRPDEGDQV